MRTIDCVRKSLDFSNMSSVTGTHSTNQEVGCSLDTAADVAKSLIHFESQNPALFNKNNENYKVNDFKGNVWRKIGLAFGSESS